MALRRKLQSTEPHLATPMQAAKGCWDMRRREMVVREEAKRWRWRGGEGRGESDASAEIN